MKLIRYFGLLTLLVGVFSTPASAAPIQPKAAIGIAQRFFSGSLRATTREQDLKIAYVAPEFKTKDEFRSTAAPQGSTGLYYVINRGEGKGFVIVAGDDRVSPILAYADEGQITPLDIADNYNLRYILGSYTQQMRQAVRSLPDRPIATLRAGASIPSQEIVVAPLLQYSSDRRTRLPQPIAWGQAWPFNNYAPNISVNGNSYPTVAGCVATVISTVMRWHRWPHHPKGTIGYNWRGYNLSTKLDGTSYDWNEMPARISGNGVDYSTGYRCTSENADQVGRLLRDVGYAVKMSYDAAFNGGSGAFTENMIGPFAKNFGYKSQVRYLYRSNYTAQTWWTEVTHELKNYGPVIYVGYGGGGGHCFVLDGYARLSEDYAYFVHVDWGWTGSQNGWYKIDILEPGSLGIGGGTGGGFGRSQSMVRYLEPDPKWENGISPQPKPEPQPSDEPQSFTLRIKEVAQASVEEGGEILIPTTLYNEGEGNFDALLKVYAVPYGADPLKAGQEIDKGEIAVGKKSSLKINLELDLNKIEPTLKAGRYSIYLAYPSSEGYYVYVRDSKGTPAICANLSVTKAGEPEPEPKPDPKPIIEPKFELGIAELWSGTLEPASAQRVSIRVRNTGGKAYNNKLALCLAKSETDARSVILTEKTALIAAERTASVDFDVDLTDKQEGDYKLYVAYYNGTRYKSIEELAGELTIERRSYKLSLYSSPIEVQGQLDERLTISLDVNNSGKLDYDGQLGLYAVAQGEELSSASLLIKGKARLVGGTHTRVNFHPTLADLSEDATYDLYLSHTSADGQEGWLRDSDGDPVPVGSLYVAEKPEPVVEDAPIAIDRVNMYQNGVYKGSSAPYISYSRGRGRFTARVYLNAERSYTGDVRVVVINSNENLLDSKIVSKRVRITAGTTNGYVDATFTTSGLRDSYYYLGLQYYDTKDKRWVTTESKFLFLVSYAAYGLGSEFLPEDAPLTQGKTYKVVAPSPVIIGSAPLLGEGLDLSKEVELLESLEASCLLFPSVTEDVLYIKVQEEGVAMLYDLTGKHIEQVPLAKGLNELSTAQYPKGSYVVRINGSVLRFIRK